MQETIIIGNINISPLLAAKEKLAVALAVEKTELVRDACIQRFEFTFELSWKTMKRILAARSNFVNSPKPVFREAAKDGLIDDVSA